ncbi:hypothetical protein CPB84DRAFT_1773571 [Gymnopilus junonius]|uniref:Uncharacterized protein n=1 Tax=Gymnopilus junonius TaxID=109634 RepID=A0A9P5NP96_GYMJU|nr:hypothetical protein CPB84DRAFT_1773571 [Gymnopilus junonius]
MPGLHSFPSLFKKITTPYNAYAFNFFLNKHNFLPLYSLLCSNLLNSFPIGHMPPLTCSTIILNHILCKEHINKIQEYLENEVKDR